MTLDLRSRSTALLVFFCLAAHLSGAMEGTVGTDTSAPERTVVERGAHHRVWQRDSFIQLGDGRTTNRPVRVVEMATGMHYWENGEWKESRDEIEIVPDGAQAVRGGHRLHLAGQINSYGAVTITTPDNKTMKSHCLGLIYADQATGQSLWVAQVQNSTGLLFPPNQVLYPNALAGHGALADVRFCYTKAGIEADVILGPNSRLPLPSAFGLNDESTLLQVCTEWVGDTPEPVRTTRTIGGLADDTLDFGAMRIGRGGVLALEAPLNRMSVAPVCKTWIKDGNRTYLLESVPFKWIRRELEQLGALQAALPVPKHDKVSGLALLRGAVPPPELQRPPVQMALNAHALGERKGLVLDYVLYAGDTNGVTFQADTTYLISGTASFFGTVTFEGSSVIKYVTTNYAIVQVFGNVLFKTDHYRPAIFTSRQDRTIGEDVYLSGAPTNYFQALTTDQSNQEFKHLRISYADYGLHTYAMKLRHAQFVHCGFALYTELTDPHGPGAEVDNVLMFDVNTAFGGGGATTAVRHVTVDRCNTLASDWQGSSSISFTNCLMANVTNRGSVNLTFDTASVTNGSDSSFQIVGAGAHYLALNSTNRNAGTTNIPSWLATDLRLRTTYPPTVVITNTLSNSLTLSITAPGNSSPADIGYAYASLDYVYGSNVLTNATLTIPAGVALGTFTPGTNIEGSAPTAALWLHNNARVVARGAPTNMVHIARYNMVQEQANDTWVSVSPYAGASIRTLVGTSSPTPSGSFSFTEWSQPGGDAPHFVSHGNNTGPFNFDNCVFSGGKFTSYTAECGVTNSLFVRVNGFVMDQPVTGIENRFFNNSFVGGSWGFYQGGGTELSWQFFNNAFYTTNIDNQHQVVHGHNAYLSGSNRIGSYASNDIILTNFSFSTGPLGYFYLPTNSSLLNTGSMSGGNAGLYWFTTTVDQQPETNSTVDIGFHLVALDSTNAATAQPLDTDADGVANYLEDRNGNGVQDVGETSVTRADSPFSSRHEPLGPSNRRTPLIISEIMYNPASGNEFIELYNTHHLPQNLSGFQFYDPDNELAFYTFTNGSVLQPGAFVSIQPVSALGERGHIQLRNKYGGVLLDKDAAVLLDVEYSNKPPWPKEADSAGHSLVLARPSYGENDPRAWAASQWRGGSPGYAETNRADVLRAVKINEFLANPVAGSGDKDSIELYNASLQPIDISGCYLSDTANSLTNFFKIPQGTVLPPRGFIYYREDDSPSFPFPLSAGGDSIFLTNPEHTRVIDAVRFEGQDSGVSMGRFPDGAPGYRQLSSRTLGSTNAVPLTRNIGVSEIMFQSVSGSEDNEYVEIHNRGTTSQSLSGWDIDGIGFTFTAGSIEPGGFVVVAFNPQQLTNRYPGQLTIGGNLFGPYSGNLANSGERVLVMDNNDVIIDEVVYRDGGRWGLWADGDGASLELMAPQSENDFAANWTDSVEPTNSTWTTVQSAGVLELGDGVSPVNALEVILLGAGECLIDDVMIVGTGNTNRVANSNFTSNATGWVAEGNHETSAWSATGGIGDSGCLRVRASDRGDYLANRVYVPLTSALTTGSNVTVSASVRWLRGNSNIVFRIRGNYFEASTNMAVPLALGSPGRTNSTWLSNVGPALYDVTHNPIVPAAGEPILVTARLHDPDGLGTNLVLRYRVDPSNTYSSSLLRDDGSAGDAVATDGLYTAAIPGQASGNLLGFYIEATDNATPSRTNCFPSDAPAHECFVRVGDPPATNRFGSYRLWLPQSVSNAWAGRSQIHDGLLDVTFVYGNERVIYNAAAAYNGSDNTSIYYDSPSGKMCGYAIAFPKDDRFLGASSALWDFSLQDITGQREQLAYWMASQLELPFNYRRYVHIFVNGVWQVNRGNGDSYDCARIFEDAQEPSSDFVEQWYPSDEQRELMKVQVWRKGYYWQNGVGGGVKPSVSAIHARLVNFTNSSGAKNLPSYRLNWRKRSLDHSANDFANFFALVDAVQTNAGASYIANVTNQMDAEQWARTFALERSVGNLDCYGNVNGQNMFAYRKAAGGKWRLFLYDTELVFNSVSDGTTSNVFLRIEDPRIQNFLTTNEFQRAYWRGFQAAINGPMQPTNYSSIIDSNRVALANDGVKKNAGAALSTGDSDVIATWINGRRNYLSNELFKIQAPLAITNSTSSSQSNILLGGTAPVEIRYLRLEGRSTNELVTWPTVSNWTFGIVLTSGPNTITVKGYDWTNSFLSWATNTIIITNTP